MDRSYESRTTVEIERKFRNLENRIMEDVVRRIRKTGGITSTADYQLNRYHILGNSTKDIEDIVMDAVGDDFPETFALYDEVIDKEYTRSKALYEQVNESFIPFDQNPQMQQLADALIRQSNDELHNITRSMGFKVDMGNGRQVFTPLSDYYNQYLDAAMLDIVSGAFDYNSVIRKVVAQMTNSGLRTVDYASGMTSRCDVAARRAIMSGLTQLTGKISDTNAEKLHTEYFEIAWHEGARPAHRVWQGKVWSLEELVTVCGLGTAGGLEGANCYHDRFAFISGISERQWSDDWLEEQNRKEDTPRLFKGKEYTRYEATQRQRYLETNMRAQRQKVKLLQEAGADSEEVMLARCKYQAQLDEYKVFSKKMGLPEQRERIYYDLRGRIAPSRKNVRRKTGELGKPTEISPNEENQKRYAARREEWKKRRAKELMPEKDPEVVNNKNRTIYDFKGNDARFEESRKLIEQLSGEYDSRLKTVSTGAHQAAGDVGDFGARMRLSSNAPNVAVHEFAHSLADQRSEKLGLSDNGNFWKEISAVRRKYRKDVGNDVTRWISAYEHSNKSLGEFFAEAFAQAKMREMGIEIPGEYGKDFTYSQKVLDITNKYFGKPAVKLGELTDYLVRSHNPGANTTAERLIANEAISSVPVKVQNLIHKGTIVDIGQIGASQYDYVNDILYVANGAEKEDVIHEIGHLVENKMIDPEKVSTLMDNIVGEVSIFDISSEVYEDAAGNPREVFLIKNSKFVSEYQGRAYVCNPTDAFNPDGRVRKEVMMEFISEPFRVYIENPEFLKTNHKEFYDLIKEAIE